MGKTSIEWTDFSINPFKARHIETGKVGHWCEKISAGCKNCYASKLQNPHLTQLAYIAENRPKVELVFDEKTLQQVLKRKKPTTWFWCDMTDMFLHEHEDSDIDKCVATMALTPWHRHIVLTKRSARLRDYFNEPGAKHRIAELAMLFRFTRDWNSTYEFDARESDLPEWPLPNVVLMVSVEDQKTADERIPDLLASAAACRGLSYEPSLGPVDFSCVPWPKDFQRNTDDISDGFDPLRFDDRNSEQRLGHLNWVIVGGESGPGARPFDIEHVKRLVELRRVYDFALFVKQMGALCMDGSINTGVPGYGGHPDGNVPLQRVFRDKKGGDISEWPEWARVRELPAVLR